MSDPKEHVVIEGERMSTIAFLEGVDAQATWDDQKNAALKKKREDPEILMPGDKVVVRKQADQHDGKPEAGNDHDEAAVLSELKLHFFLAGKPLASKLLMMTIAQTPPAAKGYPTVVPLTTQPDGSLRFHLHPLVTECTFKFLDPVFEIRLLVGHLHPIDAGGGVEQRLNNLGYHCPLPAPSPGKEQEKAQKVLRAHALARFQADIGAAVTGEGSQDALRKHTHEPPKVKA